MLQKFIDDMRKEVSNFKGWYMDNFPNEALHTHDDDYWNLKFLDYLDETVQEYPKEI